MKRRIIKITLTMFSMYKLNKFENFRMTKQSLTNKKILRAFYVVEIRIDLTVYNNQWTVICKINLYYVGHGFRGEINKIKVFPHLLDSDFTSWNAFVSNVLELYLVLRARRNLLALCKVRCALIGLINMQAKR